MVLILSTLGLAHYQLQSAIKDEQINEFRIEIKTLDFVLLWPSFSDFACAMKVCLRKNEIYSIFAVYVNMGKLMANF